MNLFTPKNIISPNMEEKYFCPKHLATTVGAATKIPHWKKNIKHVQIK